MKKPVAILIAVVFVLIVLGSFGAFVYLLFNNTPYPDETPTESLVDMSSYKDVPITDPKDLTQLTLQDMQQDMKILPGGFLQPPARTRFQCFLPPL